MHDTQYIKIDQLFEEFQDIKDYLSGIPENIHYLLVGQTKQDFLALRQAIKKQRKNQQEREYVIEIQQRYRLPLRPNSTVKATMIRARLRLKSIMARSTNSGHYYGSEGELPVDPLE